MHFFVCFFVPSFSVQPFFVFQFFRQNTLIVNPIYFFRFNTCPGLWVGQRCLVMNQRGAFTSARRLEPSIAAFVFWRGFLPRLFSVSVFCRVCFLFSGLPRFVSVFCSGAVCRDQAKGSKTGRWRQTW